MIKAVLVDDERPALRELEFLLRKYPEISVIGTYTNPSTAIEEIGQLKPQVVFLDINMPQLRGIDAASRILEGSPDTDIVFVTAFDQYAIEAFELHALDYIVKPINIDRLGKTIERLTKKKPLIKASSSLKLKIRCFGRLQVGWENQEPIKWRAEKTKELFAFLLQNSSRDISKDEILDKLWLEDNPDKAIRQLYNGIYYIRKALQGYGVDNSLVGIDNNYNLKLGPVDWDVERFCDLFKNNPEDEFENLEVMEALYTGNYLEGEFYPWADFERETLSRIYEQCIIKLSKEYMEEKQFGRAENILMKAYNKNPYAENISELLLKLYRETGNKINAVKHFNAYSDLIKKEFGVLPNEKLQELIKL